MKGMSVSDNLILILQEKYSSNKKKVRISFILHALLLHILFSLNKNACQKMLYVVLSSLHKSDVYS